MDGWLCLCVKSLKGVFVLRCHPPPSPRRRHAHQQLTRHCLFKSFSNRLSTSGPSRLAPLMFSCRLQVTSCCRSCSSGGLTGPRGEAEEEAACREVRTAVGRPGVSAGKMAARKNDSVEWRLMQDKKIILIKAMIINGLFPHGEKYVEKGPWLNRK